MYEKFYELFMKNMVTVETLKNLVAAGKLTLSQVEDMIHERLEKYGF